ncbi:MAG TPA: hypothetical protein VLW75_00050 [Rhizomicrobium sp.]|nr:hypothetical protein [Rhizomicrobium sp.]
MKPEADQVAQMSAGQLMAELMPLLPAGYAQGHAMLLGIMLGFCAQEFERGADIRAADNAEMRKLFAELAPSVRDAALQGKLVAASRSSDASLKISDLNAANYALRALVIAAQTDAEERHDAKAQAAIWSVLKASAARRVLKLPGM